VLRALTSVPDVGEAAWEGRFAEMRDAQPRAYYPLVLVEQGRIVATGTLFLERKFIRALGAAGHIEDIAVDKSQQGKGLGRVIIAALTAVSEAVGAYKTILDCSEENQREWQAFAEGGEMRGEGAKVCGQRGGTCAACRVVGSVEKSGGPRAAWRSRTE
jgi:GNAT superfamily N-acetyltransferase